MTVDKEAETEESLNEELFEQLIQGISDPTAKKVEELKQRLTR